jgi:cytoskeletal protein RodZ
MNNNLKSASSAKIGKKFSQRRLELGYSVDQISKKLFINKNYLIAIEKGDYSIFPSQAFAKAYFKKYDDYLGINCDFPNIFGQDIPRKNNRISSEINFSKSLNKNLKYFFMFIFILAVTTFLYFSLNKHIIDNSAIESKAISSEDIASVVSSVKENKLIKLKSDKTVQKSNELILNCNNECWIEVYIDENLVEAQSFSKGRQYIKEITKPFKIIIGNPEFVKGTYNDERIDFITNANRLTKVNTIYFLNE